MFIFHKRVSLKAYLSAEQKNKSIGFVPTMGALHDGHLSLLEMALKETDLVVCSIFVNPTQFNDTQDYEKYPVQTDSDIDQLLETGVDVLFLPSVEEIYPEGTARLPDFDFGPLADILEGAFRPGHFQGVGQVLQQLLKIVHPDKIFMGQKDFQQVLIVNRLIDLLQFKTKIISCPTLRDPDGLAMSSRNTHLSAEGRKKAPAIYQTLLFVKNNWRQLPFSNLLSEATDRLTKAGLKIEYITIADRKSLQPVSSAPESAGGEGTMICLVAVWLEGVRLIDNVLLN